MKLDYSLLSLEKPQHYQHKTVSVIELTDSFLISDFYKMAINRLDFDNNPDTNDVACIFNMFKYLVRMHYKGTMAHDIGKAFSYCVAFFFNVDIDAVFDIEEAELEDAKAYFGKVWEWFDMFYGENYKLH